MSRYREARRAREDGGRGCRARLLRRSETGTATVAACLALAGLLVLTVLVVHIGAVIVARHRAQAAADLTALAAAGDLRYGTEDACAVAHRLAQDAGVQIGKCAVDGWDVLIATEVRIPIGPFGMRSVGALARAGPTEEGARIRYQNIR